MPLISQLKARQCRYPLTQEALWVFCGRATAEGSSYCPRHHKVCVRATVKPIEFLADVINRSDSMSAPSRKSDEERVRPIDEVLK